MKDLSSISILGCGWLGLPLAMDLKYKGFSIKGSSTSESKLRLLKDLEISPFLINFDPDCHNHKIEEFLKSEILIINIPPSLRSKGENFHVLQMKNLIRYLLTSPVKKIIYISSTSVYPDLNKELTEEDLLTEHDAASQTLFRAEEIFRHLQGKFYVTILRCAGLAGYDRNIVKYFAGKKDLKMGNAPVNLIHRDDVIGIINDVIEKDYWNNTLNISAPQHPLRKDLYPALAKKYNYPLPYYIEDDDSPFKIVSIEKLKRELNYQFKYPDPLRFSFNLPNLN
jgi:nucleoside-diphosphate-sugar epimerase